MPFGRFKAPAYRREFEDLRAALAGWEFVCGDFADLETVTSDFIYADPPYDGPFTAYSAGGFDWAGQERLAGVARGPRGAGGGIDSGTPRIIELYERHDFTIERVSGPRSISRDGGGRQPAPEILGPREISAAEVASRCGDGLLGLPSRDSPTGSAQWTDCPRG